MPTDAEILDQKALIVWADDPSIEFVPWHGDDLDFPHGTHLESEKEVIKFD